MIAEERMNILIGSCGGLTGFYLIKELRRQKNNIRIIGVDIDNLNSSKFFVDNFFIVPKLIEEDRYISSLIEILNREKIDIYIPTLSKEIKIVAKYEQKIKRETKSKFLISPYESIEKLENKDKCYLELEKLDIKVPKLYERKEELKFPIFMKPKYGSGSKNSMKLYNLEEYEFYKKKYVDTFFMETLEGKEYTVDTFFDKKGKLISYNQRERIKANGGAVTITKNSYDFDFGDIILKISQNYLIRGSANFQFIIQENTPYLIDINLRFASGGLPLSIKSGMNIVNLLIKDLYNIQFEEKDYKVDKKERTMYRYYEEFFYEED